MIIKAINQDEFRDFSFVNSDWKSYEHLRNSSNTTASNNSSSSTLNPNDSSGNLTANIQPLPSSLSSPCLNNNINNSMNNLTISNNNINTSQVNHQQHPSNNNLNAAAATHAPASPSKMAAFLASVVSTPNANDVTKKSSEKPLQSSDLKF